MISYIERTTWCLTVACISVMSVGFGILVKVKARGESKFVGPRNHLTSNDKKGESRACGLTFCSWPDEQVSLFGAH